MNASNSAIGASASAPDAAHFQIPANTIAPAVYVGYDAAHGIGYADNTSSLTINGTNGSSPPFDITANWGLGVGIFDGGEGYFVNAGAGTITSTSEIRVGDAFGGTSHGEFYHRGSGLVSMDGYLTVGNYGGTGKFVQSSSGGVNVGGQLWVGVTINDGVDHIGNGTYLQSGTGSAFSQSDVYIGVFNAAVGDYTISNPTAHLTTHATVWLGDSGGTGTMFSNGVVSIRDYLFTGSYGGNGHYTQTGGSTEIGVDSATAPELYLGFAGGTGVLDLQGGSMTIHGWANVGRDGGTGTFNNKGLLTVEQELRLGADYGGGFGNGTLNNLSGGQIDAGDILLAIADFGGTTSEGHFTTEAGSTTVSHGPIVVGTGAGGTGYFTMNGGTVTTQDNVGPVQVGLVPGATGTFTMNDGQLTCNDWVVIGTFGGVGHGAQHGGAINTVNFDVAQDVGSLGDYVMDATTVNPQHASSITTNGFFSVGDNGTGTFDMAGGLVNVSADSVYIGWENGSNGTLTLTGGTIKTNGASDVRVGQNLGSTGRLHQTGGQIQNSDWTYIGMTGAGTYDLEAGTLSTDDNFAIGYATGGDGTMNQTGGSVTVLGNQPSASSSTSAGTGNFSVGRNGTGTLNASAGAITLQVNTVTDTFNSTSASVALAGGNPANYLTHAKDGNFYVAEQGGTGTADLSGTAVVNVAANVYVGGANFQSLSNIIGGTGTLTIRGSAQLKVGVSSPTGGDFVIGSPANNPVSSGTVNLQGGVLDVTKTDPTGTYGGSIAAGGPTGTKVFNFTGGTLKVRTWNAAGPFGGTLGNLVQNGTGSLLDVTGNNTTFNSSSYDLGGGTATIGTGRTMTAVSVINNVSGAGIINVGTGGGTLAGDYNANGTVDAADFVVWRKSIGTPAAYTTWRANFGATGGGSPALLTVGSGAVGADTLNLNNGTVTAGAGVSVATALTGGGTINGSASMASSASVSPGVSGAGKLNVTGGLTLGSSGAVNIELGGTTQTTGYDFLDVDGALAIAGTLNVTLLPGFTPTNGASFKIFDFASRTGTFGTVNFPVVPGGSWSQANLYTTGTILFSTPGLGSGGSVPEPGTLVLLGLVASVLFGVRRRR